MATSVSAQYDLVLKVTVTQAHGDQNVTNVPVVVHSLGTIGDTLTANSAVPATEDYTETITLTAGAATIDFSALDQGDLTDIDVAAAALKPQLVIFEAAAANTAGVVIVDGAANGFNIWGDANGSVTVLPGCANLAFWNDKLDDAGATDKTIDLSSSDVDAIIKVIIVFG